jgi:hypothetical protein
MRDQSAIAPHAYGKTDIIDFTAIGEVVVFITGSVVGAICPPVIP